MTEGEIKQTDTSKGYEIALAAQEQLRARFLPIAAAAGFSPTTGIGKDGDEWVVDLLPERRLDDSVVEELGQGLGVKVRQRVIGKVVAHEIVEGSLVDIP